MKIATTIAAALVVTGVGLAPVATPTQSATAAQPERQAAAGQGPTVDRKPSQREVDELARDVERLESLRDVKDVQRTFAQLSQFGEWDAMAALFSRDGTVQWGEEVTSGRQQIAAWLEDQAGAMDGRRPGSLHTDLYADPVVNLSVDGRTAKARWDGLRLLGDGRGGSLIEGGVYENEYVLEGGRWHIARLHFHPQIEGDYASGMRNTDGQQLPVVPYHFTPDSAGVPVPDPVGRAPRTRATARELAARIQRLNDEDDVRNLQHSYGYYVDRRMWSDVVDLFAPGGKVRIRGEGVFRGRDGVRRAMERMGPEGLSQGILNDHQVLDTTVEVQPGGRTAVARSTQWGMLGDAEAGTAAWSFSVLRSTFVKHRGLWRLKELDITPLMTADYATGWGDGGDAAPRRVDAPAYLDVSRTAAARQVRRTGAPGHQWVDVADLRRRLDRSKAFDGVENVSSAYAAFINDLHMEEMSGLMAQQGFKSSPAIGFYVGPERIAEVAGRYGEPPVLRSRITNHWLTQPVVLVSHDGRSASTRTRLVHYWTSIDTPGHFSSGMYNNQMVLEDGVWKAWDITIDEHYFTSKSWAEGWSAVEPRDPDAPPPPPNPVLETFPPDLALSDMGERMEGFQGGTGRFTPWPELLPMYFNHRNLVSGREPERFQRDCTPCGVRPDWSMVLHGYQLPPAGPQVDGIDVDPRRH